jgi:hypothetical protein
VRLTQPAVAPAVALAVLLLALGAPTIASGQAFNVHYDGIFHDVSRLHVWSFQAGALLDVTLSNGGGVYCALFDQPHLTGGSSIELAGACPAIQSGDLVTVTDGTSTKTHTVAAVKVTSVDYGTDVVAGTADARSQVTVVNHQGYLPTIVATAGDDGRWSADYRSEWQFDLSRCHGGEAVQVDADGDSTQFSWFPAYWCGIGDVARVYDGWVREGALVGPGTHRAFRRYLELAEGFRQSGDVPKACFFLNLARERCDGSPQPPDFVVGGAPPELDATEELAGLVRMLMEINLRCN